ncbi:MAG TPA: hypothetical protein H9663_04130, partial [Firmicutes bacterium]|nr:hypothetical protein [Bacillota bacterium]
QVVLCARGARASSQGLCPPRLWRHEPQAKYNEDPPAKLVGSFFSNRLIYIEEFSAQVAMLHGRILFALRSPRAGGARGLRRVREGVQAVGERHKVRRRTISVRRPLFRGIYHLIIPLIPESSFRRSYLRFFNLFLFVLVG